ncbi:endonuclease/exonuclease/phosphatase family protein [Rhodobacter maris]|uniref:Endonuclease/exonuclease/phosphatase family protein n=1 Tax=Rhodobacter maris TaxID=446682 RepID=A0A285SFD6_9RHOB|nr:endonuclease/exonuclease/phosphatase family protein [Rhodobacter maris]SOC06385.1 endonuclease/exonuclease/phosphatase family protein [Rhodobacter maris]
MLAAIAGGADAQVEAALDIIARADPDVLLLTDLDWDYRAEALLALCARLRAKGLDYSHFFAAQPNTGIDSGLDLDGNGRVGEARDAQGYGRFTGQHGMALVSKLPIGATQDFSGFLWGDLPESRIASADLPEGAETALRLSSTAHWDVTVKTAAGQLHLWAFAATPPVFDGPEDRNGRRNADEIGFWRHYLDGALAERPAAAPFVLIGKANLDPDRGAGRRTAMRDLLEDPRFQDAAPTGPGAPEAAPLATADFGGSVGPLRLDYILPAAGIKVTGAGVIWSETAARASDHRLVFLDLALP